MLQYYTTKLSLEMNTVNRDTKLFVELSAI